MLIFLKSVEATDSDPFSRTQERRSSGHSQCEPVAAVPPADLGLRPVPLQAESGWSRHDDSALPAAAWPGPGGSDGSGSGQPGPRHRDHGPRTQAGPGPNGDRRTVAPRPGPAGGTVAQLGPDRDCPGLPVDQAAD